MIDSLEKLFQWLFVVAVGFVIGVIIGKVVNEIRESKERELLLQQLELKRRDIQQEQLIFLAKVLIYVTMTNLIRSQTHRRKGTIPE